MLKKQYIKNGQNLRSWHSLNSFISIFCISNSSKCENQLAQDVNTAKVKDCSKLAQEGVSQSGTKNGGEVAEGDEAVEEDGGVSFIEFQELEVEWQDSWKSLNLEHF